MEARDEEYLRGSGHYCSVTLQMTFMDVNLANIPAVVNLAIQLGVDRVKGHHLWAHFPHLKEQNLRRNASSIFRWNEVALKCADMAARHNVTVAAPFPTVSMDPRPVRLQNFEPLDPGT